MLELSELQKDAITELMNIGICNAANALSQMVGSEIALSVPELHFYTPEELSDYLGPDRMVAVKQGFSGKFDGNAMLLFPQEQSKDLVKELFGDSLPLDQLSTMEEEALNELGNIILNASLATLADMLDSPINSAIPELVQHENNQFISANSAESTSMFLKVKFTITNSNISGHVLIMLDLGSAESFLGLVDAFLGQI